MKTHDYRLPAVFAAMSIVAAVFNESWACFIFAVLAAWTWER